MEKDNEIKESAVAAESPEPEVDVIKVAALLSQKGVAIEQAETRRDKGRVRWTPKQVKVLERMMAGETKPEALAEYSGLSVSSVNGLLKKKEFNEYLTCKTLENEDFYRAEMYRLVRRVIENKIEEKGGVKSEKDILDCIAEMRQLQKQAPINVNVDNRSVDLNINLEPEEIDRLVGELTKPKNE